MKFFVSFLTAWIVTGCAQSNPLHAGEREDFFEEKIRPLLISRCTECHGALVKEGELQLHHQAAAFTGGTSGKAIIPGNATNSLLYQVVSQTHDSISMPPDDSLTNDEIANLRKWITDGAVWPVSKIEFFQRSIFNTLNKSCVKCHDERQKSGGLSLVSRDHLLQGGTSGPAAVAGDAAASLLIQILSGNKQSKTNHTQLLNKKDLSAFTKWINDGLLWREPNASPEYLISDEQRQFWSFQPVVSVPPHKTNIESTNPIDHYIQAELDQHKLTPSGRASARNLIRRAYYDLLGLPPSPEQIEEFARVYATSGHIAFANLVDQLLESRHYGERWGRHWLDIVRYADTAGDAADFPVPEAYKYRNYVIDAFNKDKPYNQFVKEQIAGDLLPHGDDEERWEQILATGYIAISRRIGVSPHNLKHITIEDTINNLGTTFMGLTLGCARCHDHKFDPLPTTDYYALYGIFSSSIYPHAGAEHKPWRENFVYRIGQSEAAELLSDKRRVLEEWNKKERAHV